MLSRYARALVESYLFVPPRPLLVYPSGCPPDLLTADCADLFQKTGVPSICARHPAPRRTVVASHGNNENLDLVANWARQASRELVADVYVWEMPGYWEGGGRACEPEVTAAALAFASAVAERATTPLVFLGYSLGGAPALIAARELGRPAALVAPFASVVSVVLARTTLALALSPLWAWADVFRTLPVAAETKSPVLVVHGGADTLIRPAHGAAVAAAAPRGQFKLIEEATHASVQTAALDEVSSFFEELKM